MKALSLFSGGLDSCLAAEIIQKQKIDVEGICFISPFFNAKKAEITADELGIPLHIIDISTDLIVLLQSPIYGFGKGANPCIDCHILMVKKAGSLMQEIGASFLISGEILGQRPKSQNRWALDIVEEKSGWKDYLLRPLTAKNLPPTLPEREGWIKRENLLGIRGRTRHVQLEMARSLGIKNFPAPAGGCLLTDPSFSRKIKHLLGGGKLSLNEIELLKLGRHFLLKEGVKLIIGRNKIENTMIFQLAIEGDICLQVIGYPGPIGLLRKSDADDQILLLAASITARYSDAPHARTKVEYLRLPQKEKRYIEVTPVEDEKLETLRIGDK